MLARRGGRIALLADPLEAEEPRRAGSWRDRLAVAGAAAILAYTVYRLPPARELVRLSETPLDRSQINGSVAEYRLFVAAAGIIPSRAAVLVRSAAADPERDLFLYRYGVALLPRRRILENVSGTEEKPEFVVIVGPPPASPAGRLLLSTPDGTVWQVGAP